MVSGWVRTPVLVLAVCRPKYTKLSKRVTNLIDFLGPIFRDVVVDCVVEVEVERLERVEEKVAHVFVHVRVDDATIKVVDDAAAVHHLADQVLQRVPRYHLSSNGVSGLVVECQCRWSSG